MSPERQDRLWLIGVTALVTCLATLAGVAAVVAHIKRTPPPTPVIPPPQAITVRLCPTCDWIGECPPPTDIPPAEFERLVPLVTPDQWCGRDAHELIDQLVAQVDVTHADGRPTTVLVRCAGKNPALVTTDGRTYFYTRSDGGTGDGTIALVRLVKQIAKAKVP